VEEQKTSQPDIKPSIEKPKNNNTLLIVLLIILFLFASGIAIYAVYQNNQLKKQIAQLQDYSQQKPSKASPKPETPSVTQTFPPSNSPSQTTIEGAILEEIKYSLPVSWKAEINESQNKKQLFMSPKEKGGYLAINVYDYQNEGKRTTFCNLTNYCIDNVTNFTETSIGNISGYKATPLDNSGGGIAYFGAKGNKFYIINIFSPPAPNNFGSEFQKVLDSLRF